MKAKVIISIILFLTVSSLYAQRGKQNSIPMIGSQAPPFTAETTNGELNFPEDFGDSWKILFSHPKDFTPVCTHEILHLALIQDELEELDVVGELVEFSIYVDELEELCISGNSGSPFIFNICI